MFEILNRFFGIMTVSQLKFNELFKKLFNIKDFKRAIVGAFEQNLYVSRHYAIVTCLQYFYLFLF